MPTNMTTRGATNSGVEMNGDGDRQVHHNISNRNVYVPYFSGNVPGQSLRLEEFLDALDNYLATKHGLTEREKIAEAKSFLNYDKGDLHCYTLMDEFRFLSTYDAFKAYLRKTYRSGAVVTDPVFTYLDLMRSSNADRSEYRTHGAKDKVQIEQWISALSQNSDWVDDDGKLTPRNVGQLLWATQQLYNLPKTLVNAFEKKWKPTYGLAELTQLIHKHKDKCPEFDAATGSLTQAVHALSIQGRATQGSSKHTSQTKESDRSVKDTSTGTRTKHRQPQRHRSKSNAQNRRNLQCFKCGKFGHPQSLCRTGPRCPEHGSHHKYIDCPDLYVERDRYRSESSSPGRYSYRRSQTPPNFRRQSPSPGRYSYYGTGQGYGYRSRQVEREQSWRSSGSPRTNFRVGSPFRGTP